MNNVYEITITKEVMKTNTHTEVVGVEEISNQTRETMESFFREKYGEGEEGVSINIVSSPSKQKPEKYFGDNKQYDPSILHYADFGVMGTFEEHKKEHFLGETISFPENTKSVLYYIEEKYRRTTKLPNNILYFHSKHP